MDKKVKKHSFMFIPSKGAIKQLSLDTKKINWFIAFVAVIIIANIGFFVYNVRSAQLYSKTDKLITNNRKASENIGLIEAKLDSSRQTLEVLSQLERQMRVMAGLDQVSDSSGVIGFGGIYLRQRPEKSSILDKRAYSLSYALDSLIAQTELQIQSYTTLCSTFTRKQNILQRTPSIVPMKGYMTSMYGPRNDPFTGLIKMHEGIDIVAPKGTPIIATADGVISFTGWYHGYGKMVKINHKYYETRFGHMDQIKVRRGQKVKRGDILGTCGRTGRATANHVHYEVRVAGKAQDPINYIYPAKIVTD